jgi:hypothetical protein
MIQRIQSLYILLSFTLSCVLFSLSLDSTSSTPIIQIYQSFYGFIITPLIALITLLLFKKRPLQALLCFLIVLFQMTQGGIYLSRFDLSNGFNFDELVILISFINVVLFWLARRSILRDEALVRSIDRIR